ncbi:MAG: hypothetical protein JWL62_1923 [Hyphomicrobiales bacterium]|nr:hypothetical protein [Hyphomicrobiales bacterium]
MIFVGSNPAKEKQDHQNNKDKAEATAPVVACPIKRAAANFAKAAQQRDYQDDDNNGPY